MLSPKSSQEPWVGEAVTDILHYFDVKDPDPEVATEQKEALSGAIDLFSPQGLGGLMLMGAGSIGRAAGNIGNRAIRIARGANRKPAKGAAVGEGGYAQLYETDSVSKYASRKLPRVTQERGVNIFKDKTYNYVESVKPRRGGMSIHTVKVRGRDKYSNEQNLGFLEFNVQDLNPMYKGQLGPIDEAIEMVSGKGLESPKLISNIKFKTTDIGSPRDAARALRMVFDRFDDDWIIHENLMTLDSINMMLSSILRNYGEEIEFFANR